MKRIFIPLIICWCQFIGAQDYRDFKRAFHMPNEYDMWAKTYYVCNKDESFYKSDTLRFYYDSATFYETKDCCTLICWDVVEKNEIAQSTLNVCKDPPWELMPMNENYKIVISKIKDTIILKRKRKNFKSDEFSLIHLERTNGTIVGFTLLRRK